MQLRTYLYYNERSYEVGRFPTHFSLSLGAPKSINDKLHQPLNKWSTPWSAAARRRFGQRRLVAASLNQLKRAWPRQVATGQSAARPAHSKELSHSLDQTFLKCVGPFAVHKTERPA